MKTITRSVFRAAILVLGHGAILILISGCGKSEPTYSKPVAIPLASLDVFYTCDTRGHLYPCECTGGHAGGITRRSAYLKANQGGPALLVDAGNNTAGGREWEILELEHLFKAKERMGYHAVNLGHNEARLEVETLKALGKKHPMLISANLVATNNWQPVLPPFRVVDVEGTKVGIIGIMSDQVDGVGEGLHIETTDGTIARYLEDMKSKADLLVCLYYGDELALQELADQFYEFSVIVGGKVSQPSNEPVVANQSVIVYNSDKGKNIGHLSLTPKADGEGWEVDSNSITTLYTDEPEDLTFQDILDGFERKMDASNFDREKTKTDDAEGLQTIGGGQ